MLLNLSRNPVADDRLLLPLSDTEVSRLRYGKSYKPKKKFTVLGPRYGPFLGLYLDTLPSEDSRLVERTLAELGVFKAKGEGHLYEMLSTLTTVAKKHGTLLFEKWWLLVNLERGRGFEPLKNIEDFADDVRQWVSGDKVHTIDGDETKFLEYMRQGIAEFYGLAPGIGRANSEAKTIEEWLSDLSNWARPGSSMDKRSLVYYDGNRMRKPRRSKWRTAMTLPLKEVAATIRGAGPRVQKASAIQKQEIGKVRAVINSGDETYFRMAYVSDWLERALRGHPRSALFRTNEQQFEFWTRLSRHTQSNTIKVPLDQAHFDWQQNKRMHKVFFDETRRLLQFATPGVKEDLFLAMDAIERDLSGGKVKVGNHRMPIEKGILSGWRWTALMDTVYNYAELYAAERMLKERGFFGSIISKDAQGDDDEIEVTSVGTAAGLVLAYEHMNFEINPQKYFVDLERDEYLRKRIDSSGVYGYPARIINSLLYRGPLSKDPPSGLLRMDEQAENWGKLISRGGDLRRTLKHMLRDLSNANGVSKIEVSRILSTPAAMGGLGMFERTLKPLAFSPGKRKRTVRYDLSSAPGLMGAVGLFDFRDPEEVAQRLANEVLEVDGTAGEVLPGRVKEVQDVSALAWDLVPSSGFPTSARTGPGVTNFLSTVILEELIETKQYERIHLEWVHPDLVRLSQRIERNGGRGVWFAWLRGKLPFKVPKVVGWGTDWVGTVYARMAATGWQRLVGRSKFTLHTVKRLAVTAEAATRRWLGMQRRVLGG
jgi:hypothetical protein